MEGEGGREGRKGRREGEEVVVIESDREGEREDGGRERERGKMEGERGREGGREGRKEGGRRSGSDREGEGGRGRKGRKEGEEVVVIEVYPIFRLGMLGSVDANTGSPDLGWDTDQFKTCHSRHEGADIQYKY